MHFRTVLELLVVSSVAVTGASARCTRPVSSVTSSSTTPPSSSATEEPSIIVPSTIEDASTTTISSIIEEPSTTSTSTVEEPPTIIPSSTSTTATPTPTGNPNCGPNQTLNLCCMNVAPWSTNSGVWGGICGYFPSIPSERVGARCISVSSSGTCPSGTTAVCCAGFIPGQCALGTQCAAI